VYAYCRPRNNNLEIQEAYCGDEQRRRKMLTPSAHANLRMHVVELYVTIIYQKCDISCPVDADTFEVQM
jgi:hypothetical protein